MAIPKYNELYPNVLNVLSDGKEHSIHEIDEIISDQLNLTEEDAKPFAKNILLCEAIAFFNSLYKYIFLSNNIVFI